MGPSLSPLRKQSVKLKAGSGGAGEVDGIKDVMGRVLWLAKLFPLVATATAFLSNRACPGAWGSLHPRSRSTGTSQSHWHDHALCPGDIDVECYSHGKPGQNYKNIVVDSRTSFFYRSITMAKIMRQEGNISLALWYESLHNGHTQKTLAWSVDE